MHIVGKPPALLCCGDKVCPVSRHQEELHQPRTPHEQYGREQPFGPSMLLTTDLAQCGDAAHRQPIRVFTMLPLDTVNHEGVFRYASSSWFVQALQILANSGVYGVAVDIWWGAVEQRPRVYNWSGYKQLLEAIKHTGLKVQVVLSFHACGGNVGDTVQIPLPRWVLQCGEHDPDIFFTDRPRHGSVGQRNREYISIWADDARVLQGRTPMCCYEDFMVSFRDAMTQELGSVIDEVVVGTGPCGELRFPAYVESNGWRFPGVGEFQCYDRRALASLAQAAREIGKPEWGNGGPHDAGSYCSTPESTGFFSRDGSWDTPYGRFFLQWYSGSLLKHGERLLATASTVFARKLRPRLVMPGSNPPDWSAPSGPPSDTSISTSACFEQLSTSNFARIRSTDLVALEAAAVAATEGRQGQASGAAGTAAGVDAKSMAPTLSSSSMVMRSPFNSCGGSLQPSSASVTELHTGEPQGSPGPFTPSPSRQHQYQRLSPTTPTPVSAASSPAPLPADCMGRTSSSCMCTAGRTTPRMIKCSTMADFQSAAHTTTLCSAVSCLSADTAAAATPTGARGGITYIEMPQELEMPQGPGYIEEEEACLCEEAGAQPSGRSHMHLHPAASAGSSQPFSEAFQDVMELWKRSSLSSEPGQAQRQQGGGISLTLKIAGVHWWYKSASHAAELTSGYFNTSKHDGYAPIIDLCARYRAGLTLTCVEMCDGQHPTHAQCGPEGLLKQIKALAARAGVHLAGENALPIFLMDGVDSVALDRVVFNSRAWHGAQGPRQAGLQQQRGLQLPWAQQQGSSLPCSAFASPTAGVANFLHAPHRSVSVQAGMHSHCGAGSSSNSIASLTSAASGSLCTTFARSSAMSDYVPFARSSVNSDHHAVAATGLQMESLYADVHEGLPAMRAFTFLRLGPELLLPKYQAAWNRFMARMQQGGHVSC